VLEPLRKFERLIVTAVTGMMVLVILLGTIELGYLIILDIISPPIILLEVGELLNIFGLFLLILIGVVLLETVKMYFRAHVVHVEVVFMVALIAIARKVIILDLEKYSYLALIGIALIILALSVGYYLVRKSHQENKSPL